VILSSTQTLATEIPARAMLDLEPLGGEGFSEAYGTMVSAIPATGTGLTVVVLHEGVLVAFSCQLDTTIPVVTYVSNMLETATY
jgi:hypothetical protein